MYIAKSKTLSIMDTIQANSRGTRFIEVSDENLATIHNYKLFNQLLASHGIIGEEELNKLRLTIRSLIATQESDCTDLIDLCIDVIYHKDMKAYGLNELFLLYKMWQEEAVQTSSTENPYL